MDLSGMQHYLTAIQLKWGKNRDREGLLAFIDQEEKKQEENADLQLFFMAERAFHREDYEQALKQYIQAKSIPLFQFYCYRASAFIAEKRGHREQAFRLAKKAATLVPDDLITRALLQQLSQEHSTEPHPLKEIPPEFSAEQITYRLLQDADLPMHTPLSTSGVPPSNATLTRRFYSLASHQELSHSFQPSTQEPIMSTTELETPSQSYETVSHPSLDALNNAEHVLEARIQSFQKQRAQCLSHYIKRSRQRKQPLDNCLYVFNGWINQPKASPLIMGQEDVTLAHFLLSPRFHRPSSGFYLKWQGKGIVINPGKHFLDQFHQVGLHINDIDMVIVTQTDHDAYSDVKEIYELNYQLNKINSELQIIHYYLNHKAYLELSSVLKPNFRQERNAIHSLELFVDSPDIEKIDLTPEITLNYFPTSTKEALSHHRGDKSIPKHHNGSPLGIRFDLRSPAHHGESRRLLKIGYLSGTPWSPLLGHHLGPCDLLFTGFGHTHINDFSKLNYNENCLGYFGTYSLLEEVKPRLLLCCEFDGREGDIRLEVSKKMRQELAASALATETLPVVLPADNGLYIDLKNLEVRCSVSQEMVAPSQIRVVKSGEAFSSLLYLAPTCLLE